MSERPRDLRNARIALVAVVIVTLVVAERLGILTKADAPEVDGREEMLRERADLPVDRTDEERDR